MILRQALEKGLAVFLAGQARGDALNRPTQVIEIEMEAVIQGQGRRIYWKRNSAARALFLCG